MICYVMTEEEWSYAREEDEYWPDNFDELGYIPCADPEYLHQLIFEMNLADESIYVLKMDPQHIESVIIHEDVHEQGIMFPHIYGYINLDAVISAEPFSRDSAPLSS